MGLARNQNLAPGKATTANKNQPGAVGDRGDLKLAADNWFEIATLPLVARNDRMRGFINRPLGVGLD